MKKLTPKKVNQFTNIIAAIRSVLFFAMFAGYLQLKETVGLYLLTGIISSFLDGRGIPTIGQITREIQINLSGSEVDVTTRSTDETDPRTERG